jgi:C1A family cysteine protease
MAKTSVLLQVLCLSFVLSDLVYSACTPEQEAKWTSHKKSQGRKFKDSTEETKRKTNFCQNDDFIKAHNSKPGQTYKLAPNHLQDYGPDEMKAYNKLKHLTPKPAPKPAGKRAKRQVLNLPPPTVTWTVPASLNWTAQGIVNTPNNQGQCGSCYAFSATGALEAKMQLAKSTPFNLSEEQIVDCSGGTYGNLGCGGGLWHGVYKYVADKGLNSESSYPYTQSNYPSSPATTCQNIATPTINPSGVASTLGYQWIMNPWPTNSIDDFWVLGLNNAGNEDLLKKWVAKQPIAVSMHASMPDFQSYSSGIYNNMACPGTTGGPAANNNHAVLIVGYGTDAATGLDYWIVKNSWGGWPKCTTTKQCITTTCTSYYLITSCTPGWGQGGYMLLRRGVNMCGIANYAIIPTYS